jgi:hypothetical protein
MPAVSGKGTAIVCHPTGKHSSLGEVFEWISQP